MGVSNNIPRRDLEMIDGKSDVVVGETEKQIKTKTEVFAMCIYIATRITSVG